MFISEKPDYTYINSLTKKIDKGDYSNLDRLVYMVISYGIADKYLPYIKLATKNGNVQALDYYYGHISKELKKKRARRQKLRKNIFIAAAIAVIIIGMWFILRR